MASLRFLKVAMPSFLEERLIYLLHKRKKKSLKNKTKGLQKKCGRNNKGIITIRHKGNGNKNSYRQIDYSEASGSLLVEQLEYDPLRNAQLARIFATSSGYRFYCIASSKLEVGCFLPKFPVSFQKIGFYCALGSTHLGTIVNCLGTNVRLFLGILQRTAGTFGQLLQKGEKNSIIRLSSGKKIELLSRTRTALGTALPNASSQKTILGKAGRNRRKNIRPVVRGVAMNSNDHPHGGGEGKSSSGRPSVNPWGKSVFGKRLIKK